MTNAKRNPKTETTVKSRRAKNSPLVPVSAKTPPAAKPDLLSSPLGKTPLFKERLGRMRLAIWAREDKSGAVRFSVKLTRSYKTETGFADTSSLDQGDLAHAVALLLQAQSLLPPLPVSELQP